MDYKPVGNITDYRHEPRIVVPRGLLEIPDPALVLKMYAMHKIKDSCLSQGFMDHARELLTKEVTGAMLEPQLGIGFVIVTGDSVNAALWDKQAPHVLRNNYYAINLSDGTPHRLNPEDIRETGAFCAFELGIVGHEAETWRNFLMVSDVGTSAVIDGAKKTYLQSFYEGRV